MFDPYLQWLGIPRDKRPISCYSLLGLTPKEAASPDAVDEAAAAIAARLREHKNGPHAEACARLLKEVAQARAVLIDPAKRKVYDARLRQKAAAAAPVEAEVVEAQVVEADDDGFEEVADDQAAEVQEESKPERRKPARRKPAAEPEVDEETESDEEPERKKSPVLLFVALGAAALVLLLGGGGIAAYLLLREDKPDSRPIASLPATPTRPEEPAPSPTSRAQPKVDPSRSDPPRVDPPKPTPPKPAPPPAAAAGKPPEKARPPVVKLAVPDSEAQAKAEKALKDAYKADYAKTKPDDRTVLAAKFLVPGREDRNDPAAWFVMLREARDLGIEAKKPRLVFEAISEMDRHFVIDAVDMRLKAIADLTKSGGDFVVAATFRATQNLLQQAYYDENFDAARRYLDAIEVPVREVKGEQVLKRLREQRTELADYAREFEAVTAARTRLTQSPDDPEANLAAGRFLCFFQGEWDRGLPMLARGSHAGLKDLARKDLAAPADIKEQLAIADGWWSWCETLGDRGQLLVAKRARLWYEKAGATATGTDRAHVIERIMEAQRREFIRFPRLLPGSFLGRNPEDRVLLLREGGGNVKSEEAIERGLQWLAEHQWPTGAWTTDGFHRAGKCKCSEPGEKHDIAGTAFGLLPFLGAGETHKRGKYSTVVQKGLNFLLQKQAEKFPAGNFSDNAYENALASIAVIEAYGMTKDRSLQGPAQAAASYIASAQFSDGSWGYSKGTKGDTSVSGWQFTALKAAAYAGLAVPKETLDRLTYFLDSVADASGTGYGYNSPGAAPATSAVGILCREFLNWGPGHPGLTKAVDNLLRADNYLAKDKNNIYAVFYIAQVAHHLGGQHWEKWNTAVRDLLIELQDKGDDPQHAHQKGSWSPRGDAYAKQGGRLMYTSLSLITLEIYYYHIPLYGYGPYVLLD